MDGPFRRHGSRGQTGPLVLPASHPAVLEDRPLFPSMLRSANSVGRVLKPGSNSKKLGSHFSKGPWAGRPIYSLSLAERLTCPTSCQVRNACYGNRMQLAPRFVVDEALYAKLTVELDNLASVFEGGYAVRLHALGDFPDVEYVEYWIRAVRRVRALHVFGFTAHERWSDIGRLIERQSRSWDRFRLRFSGSKGGRSAVVQTKPPWGRHEHGVTCPANADHSHISCGSCGFCITSRDPVVFGLH